MVHGAQGADRVVRILALAPAGPVVAYLLALALTHLLTLFRGPLLERMVLWQQITGFMAAAIAYGANDGQKILAVLSVLLGAGVARPAADPGIIGLTIACFAAGTMLGLRRSANGLRRGVLHPKPYQVASTVWAAASAVLTGSALAAPVGMSQAIIGSAPPRVAAGALGTVPPGLPRLVVDSARGGDNGLGAHSCGDRTRTLGTTRRRTN